MKHLKVLSILILLPGLSKASYNSFDFKPLSDPSFNTPKIAPENLRGSHPSKEVIPLNPWEEMENKITITLKPIIRKAHPHREMAETLLEYLSDLKLKGSLPKLEEAAPAQPKLLNFISLLNLIQTLKNIEKFDPACPKSIKAADKFLNPKIIDDLIEHLSSKDIKNHNQDLIFNKLISEKIIPPTPSDHFAVAGHFVSTVPQFQKGMIQLANPQSKHPQYDLVGNVYDESLMKFKTEINEIFRTQIPAHIFQTPGEFLRQQLLISWNEQSIIDQQVHSFNFYFYPAVKRRYAKLSSHIPGPSSDLPDDLFKFNRIERQELPKDISWKMTQKNVGFGLSSYVNQDMDNNLRERVKALQAYLEFKATEEKEHNQNNFVLFAEYLETMQISYGLSFDLEGNPLDKGPDAFFKTLKADFEDKYTLKQKIDQEAYRLGTLLMKDHKDFLTRQALTTWMFNPINK